ncbi:unnamed protein product [Coffea canephora]|uniref:Uncharacterized protein n=1 Tax=Coffea canephora TaxID=49390 RepID=A0A068UX17_COFCA|nr:unnamed protein product [Coffea canephora]
MSPHSATGRASKPEKGKPRLLLLPLLLLLSPQAVLSPFPIICIATNDNFRNVCDFSVIFTFFLLILYLFYHFGTHLIQIQPLKMAQVLNTQR